MPVTASEVRHFLGRVGFSPTQADVAYFENREVADIVNDVLTMPADLPPQPGHLYDSAKWEANQRTVDWWLTRMKDSTWSGRNSSMPHPLIEKMAFFWHGHFATGYDKVQDPALMWQQNQFFRDNALGDFEQLCQLVSRHGAMLIYLDNESNVAGGVQENFARELMELFTMGVGNYTETDVVEMARAWTGHGTIGWIQAEQRYDGTYEFHPDEHDNGQKTIFGITQNWDGPATITEICKGSKQWVTARFIATKLWRFFVNGAPTPATIDSLASTFVASNMNVRELMRALLIHPDFWAPVSRNALVKTPTQFVVDFARKTNVAFNRTNMKWYMRPMGQTLLDPPNVAGWGTNGYWLSTATMWGRAKFIKDQRWQITDPEGQAFLQFVKTMDPVAGTSEMLAQLGIFEPSTATTNSIRAWFSTTQQANDWAIPPIGLSLICLCPEFQVI